GSAVYSDLPAATARPMIGNEISGKTACRQIPRVAVRTDACIKRKQFDEIHAIILCPARGRDNPTWRELP
ncbi:MAG: hypothetical protein QGG09_16005, partial [Pirellulaceae bacterium]|nr:hypothetical protein [Pirellulaceae bacterium]